MSELHPEDPDDAVDAGAPPVVLDGLERSRLELRGLLHSARRRRFSSEFPRSRTMRIVLDARHRTMLLAVGGGVLMMLVRRLPAGRAAALLSLYRGVRQGIDLSRH